MATGEGLGPTKYRMTSFWRLAPGFLISMSSGQERSFARSAYGQRRDTTKEHWPLRIDSYIDLGNNDEVEQYAANWTNFLAQRVKN